MALLFCEGVMNQRLLWCDLQSDEDRILFLESGAACDTGIIAPVMVGEILALYRKIQAAKNEIDLIYSSGQDERCDAVAQVESAIDSVVIHPWVYPSK
jgi:hypothetical protein